LPRQQRRLLQQKQEVHQSRQNFPKLPPRGLTWQLAFLALVRRKSRRMLRRAERLLPLETRAREGERGREGGGTESCALLQPWEHLLSTLMGSRLTFVAVRCSVLREKGREGGGTESSALLLHSCILQSWERLLWTLMGSRLPCVAVCCCVLLCVAVCCCVLSVLHSRIYSRGNVLYYD